MHGPIDFIVVGFPGNKFKGDILRELNAAVKNNTIAILDMSLITKDANGNVSAVELTDEDVFLELIPDAAGDGVALISKDDVDEVGQLLDNDSSAGLLVIEQLWAKGLKQAIKDADGVLVADGRIHPEASDELNAMEE